MSDPSTPDFRTLLKRSLEKVAELRAALAAREQDVREPLAIVGIGCRFPGGADSPDEFWRVLQGGVDLVRELPEARWPFDPALQAAPATRWAGFLDHVDCFDAGFFGISPREAAVLDPQQRLLLEVAWEALEDAGQPQPALSGSRTGVFVGLTTLDYQQRVLAGEPTDLDVYSLTGNSQCFAAGRLSYLLGLQGPCVAVDTACSSSLTAVHLACDSLRDRQCDLALAGGVNLILSPVATHMLAQAQALSPSGRCRTFDAAADGFVRGEGCGVVVLKRLADARRDGDRIWALVRGSAINQDGRSTGLTAPNVLSQQALLRDALARAGLAPEQVAYIETHGTGTPLGDPIEIEALKAVYGRPRDDGSLCRLGALKTCTGHLEAAAGVAGLIKAVLALHHRQIPKNLNFETLNPRISLQDTPLVVAAEATPWEPGPAPRIAGISAFGFSGSNAHVLIEEPPRDSTSPADPPPASSALASDSPQSPRFDTRHSPSPGPAQPLAPRHAPPAPGALASNSPQSPHFATRHSPSPGPAQPLAPVMPRPRRAPSRRTRRNHPTSPLDIRRPPAPRSRSPPVMPRPRRAPSRRTRRISRMRTRAAMTPRIAPPPTPSCCCRCRPALRARCASSPSACGTGSIASRTPPPCATSSTPPPAGAPIIRTGSPSPAATPASCGPASTPGSPVASTAPSPTVTCVPAAGRGSPSSSPAWAPGVPASAASSSPRSPCSPAPSPTQPTPCGATATSTCGPPSPTTIC
ncbi:type I polyketide synthase [Nannocystis exedens]|nr:type I polyketide synthase [Nannocystis exedens]